MNFQRNLFLSIGAVFLALVLSFLIYQHRREQAYKIDLMQSRLQMYAYEMAQTLGDSLHSPDSFYHYVERHDLKGLRVSLIARDGRVLLDSRQRDVSRMNNHLGRKEVRQALRDGSGYDVKRASESTKETYFYYAMLVENEVLRVAVPHDAELMQSLKADNSYLYYTLVLTLLLGFALYYNTSRIGRHIKYLRKFAQQAEAGKDLDHELERVLPDDELGDISHTIITLYWKLRHSEEDKARIKRQLTQNAAHELKTPAASIHGFLESVLDNPDMPEAQRQHFLKRCYVQSERMNKLLRDMSVLIRLTEEDYTQSLEREPVDINELVSDVLADASLSLNERGITSQVDIPKPTTVYGDRDLLYGVFRNLVDNAIFYAMGASTIRISCVESSNEYVFHVSDNGVGVEPQHLPRIFERFYRVDKGRTRKQGGTGLGMAIVKNAVTAHGGTILAEETLGGGLTIRFTLPK